MDTGYGNLIDEQTRVDVLRHTRIPSGGEDSLQGHLSLPDRRRFRPDAYYRQIEQIQSFGGSQRSSNPSG
jgi:hypothetical protein